MTTETAVFLVKNGMLMPDNDARAENTFGERMKDGWYFQVGEEEPAGPFEQESGTRVLLYMEMMRREMSEKRENVDQKSPENHALRITSRLIEEYIERRTV